MDIKKQKKLNEVILPKILNIYSVSYLSVIFILFFTGCNESNDEDIITDGDGNIYHSITIGSQDWLVENLKTTKFCNGDPIPNDTDITQWYNMSTPSWIYYQNNLQNNEPYGKLYNFYAVLDNRNICPCGWHVPSKEEWETLNTNVYAIPDVGYPVGGKLKEIGSDHWMIPNSYANNVTGFTALPSGNLNSGIPAFMNMYISGRFWSSTDWGSSGVVVYVLSHNDGDLSPGTAYKQDGFAVRCVKD